MTPLGLTLSVTFVSFDSLSEEAKTLLKAWGKDRGVEVLELEEGEYLVSGKASMVTPNNSRGDWQGPYSAPDTRNSKYRYNDLLHFGMNEGFCFALLHPLNSCFQGTTGNPKGKSSFTRQRKPPVVSYTKSRGSINARCLGCIRRSQSLWGASPPWWSPFQLPPSGSHLCCSCLHYSFPL